MPYGSIFDVGVDIKLVEICLKLFLFAKHRGREKEYTLAMATAIWANGVNIEDRGNVDKLLRECGLGIVEYAEYERNHITKNEHIWMTEQNLASHSSIIRLPKMKFWIFRRLLILIHRIQRAQ